MRTVRLLMLCLLGSAIASAQVTSEYGYAGGRGAALAGSAAMAAASPWGLFDNPASLARLEGFSVVLAHQRVFGFSFLPYTALVATIPAGQFGTAAIGFDRLAVEYGGRSITTEQCVRLGAGGFLQRDVYSTLAAGASLRVMQVDYGRSAGVSGDGSDGAKLGQAHAVGIDAGFLASLRDRHWVGASVSNLNRPEIGTGSSAVRLPARLQAGVAYAATRDVITSFQMTRVQGRVASLHSAIDYRLHPSLRLMAGAQSNPARLGLGGVVEWKGLIVEYGLLTHPVLPATHQLAMGVAL